ncbi:hypothetical protein BD626DRAFT_259320 [Schizophyllum amplum]|uniref:Uncharacterized protein n=1 Tax=Schizophyllum amplum TaxID=97359 RepID=A0A550BUF3_9AGAR|nr:hypothetical protein BD626DRAFT_259320 [Auriculariopsis ampla]
MSLVVLLSRRAELSRGTSHRTRRCRLAVLLLAVSDSPSPSPSSRPASSRRAVPLAVLLNAPSPSPSSSTSRSTRVLSTSILSRLPSRLVRRETSWLVGSPRRPILSSRPIVSYLAPLMRLAAFARNDTASYSPDVHPFESPNVRYLGSRGIRPLESTQDVHTIAG